MNADPNKRNSMSRVRLMKKVLFVFAAASVLQAADTGRDLRLMDAVKRRDVKAFETLLAQGIDINASAPDGATALAWAAFLDLCLSSAGADRDWWVCHRADSFRSCHVAVAALRGAHSWRHFADV